MSPRLVCLQLPGIDFGLDVRKGAPAVSEEGQDFISGLIMKTVSLLLAYKSTHSDGHTRSDPCHCLGN